MARTLSTMLPLGTEIKYFELLDPISGSKKSIEDLQSDLATVIMFICNHCPFVKHVNEELVRLGQDYIPVGVSFIAINSNNMEAYPEDAPDKMIETSQALDYPFPYLFDETQEVAKAYDAACTPDFFIFDGKEKLVYRGQLDDSSPGNVIPVTGKDIRGALDAILEGREVPHAQRPSIGCNIKWKY
ncbi:MAG: thioredoxin family protein [Flavobacteriales bacterium AspAUS03]